ncbi:hypothetical protein ACFYZJ_06555 [Streptomyces sp. NPDC001848]|uniref:hypothetical protein n=1 Tax=Streptomyces sp. NPDC001848 TaxID=3364618 RepID=UPI0036793D58
MSAAPDDSAPHTEGRTLAAEVEGCLLAHAEYDRAHREAEALCARLPWLTTAQAEDLVRHYVSRRLDITRRTLATIARRAGQLRDEYEARYAALRRALLRGHAACACALLGITGLVTAWCFLTR